MIVGALHNIAADAALVDRATAQSATFLSRPDRRVEAALSPAAIQALSWRCAPNVALETVAAIVRTESRGKFLALHVNGSQQPEPQRSVAEAIETARASVAGGHSVDLGLGQINSRNMRKLGLSWDTVFDPCTNMAALGRVITKNYAAALIGREPQAALRVAFSLYNTGSPSRGFRNGYVERVVRNAGASDRRETNSPVSSADVTGEQFEGAPETKAAAPVATVRDIAPPAWNIFARAAYARRATLSATTIRSKSVWSE